MNGFLMYADTFRKNGQERKAELYEFLGNCTDDDICSLFDSTAFNERAKTYMRKAVSELQDEGVIDEEQALAVRNRYARLFDEMQAKQVIS